MNVNSFNNLTEKKFSEFIDDNVQILIDLAKSESSIDSVLAIGSLAKRSLRFYSNINLVFVINSTNIDLFLKIQEKLNPYLQFSIKHQHKYLFYVLYNSTVDKKICNIEIHLISDIKKFSTLITGSNIFIDDLENLMLFNRNNENKELLIEILQDNKAIFEDYSYWIINSILRFIEYFEKATSNLRKFDIFLFFSAMNECYYELVKLENFKANYFSNNIKPVFAYENMNFLEEFPFYRKNTPRVSITNNDIRKEYFKKFIDLLTILEIKFKLNLNLENIGNFLKILLNEAQIWNLRDIAYLSDSLKKGVLYRSSSLSRYNNRQELQEFIDNNNINTILDLRSSNEVESQPYEDDILKNLKYFNIPIAGKEQIDLTQLKYTDQNNSNSFYEIFLRFHQEEIRNIITTVATCKPGIVIHCFAGRDRTGLVVALLLHLLDIDSKLITEDYLNSGNNTNLMSLDIFNRTLEEFGGIKNYFDLIGVSSELIVMIRRKFLCE
jgi:protein tyrosine/serine phosphatase